MHALAGRTRSAFVVAALALAAAPARAQLGGVNPFSFGVSGGLSVPTGDFSDAFGTGYNVDAFVGVRVPTLPVSFRFEGGYQEFGLKGSAKDRLRNADIEGDVKARIISGTANLVYTIAPPASVVRPYLIGGAGVYNLRTRGTGDVGDFLEEFVGTREESTTRLGLNGGVGVEVPLSGISVFGEARVHTIFTPSERDPESGDRVGGRTTIVPIKVGIRF
jgi:hypothetical protein